MCVCVVVLVIIILVFTPFCIVKFMYIYSSLCYCNEYCHRTITQLLLAIVVKILIIIINLGLFSS